MTGADPAAEALRPGRRGRGPDRGAQRVASFGRPLPDQVDEPAQPAAIELPAATMPVILALDDNTLAAICDAVRDGIYHAARRALADAVTDFAAEQEQASDS